MTKPPQRLDVLGLFCPVPILLAARAMQALGPGDLLEIVGDDPGIREDLPAWCDHAGHRLVALADERGGKIRGLVEKGQPRRKG